jgi:nucleotide-binding universal stress UspA family protein
MTIHAPDGVVLCGTDFSPLARQAAQVAATWAQLRKTALHLVHVVDHLDQAAVQKLEDEARTLPGEVHAEALTGLPDEVLARRAGELSRNLSDWLLGSTADRLVRSSSAPCLVLREPQRLTEWLSGRRPLVVLLAFCPDNSTRSALEFARGLAGLGPVKLLAVQVSGGPNLDQQWVKAESERLQAATGLTAQECLVEVAMWPVEQHLLERARERQCDLIVLGTHHRTGFERLWRGSVSTPVVQRAPVSVVCVPDAAVPAVGRS